MNRTYEAIPSVGRSRWTQEANTTARSECGKGGSIGQSPHMVSGSLDTRLETHN